MQTEIFYEKLYARRKTAKTIILQTLVALATIAAASMAFVLIMAVNMALRLPLATFAMFGIVYFGYKQFRKFNVEFEYIYLNGEMDVDKIVSKAERARIITVKMSELQKFGAYNAGTDNMLSHDSFVKKIDVRSNTNADVYYAIFNNAKFGGRVLMLFEPDERILADIRRYINF